MKHNFTNVHCAATVGAASVHFEMDGCRFHWWVARGAEDQLTPDGDVLYKNPPLGVGVCDDGYFHTRRLDMTKPKNAALVEAVRLRAIHDDALRSARLRASAARNAELAQQQREARTRLVEHVRWFAEQLGTPIAGWSEDQIVAGL